MGDLRQDHRPVGLRSGLADRAVLSRSIEDSIVSLPTGWVVCDEGEIAFAYERPSTDATWPVLPIPLMSW